MRAFKFRLATLAIAIASIALTVLSASTPARAEFPERSVKIVVPFAPGGGTDLIARVLAEFMSKDLGQPVIVENKPGAGTIVGTAAAASSAPDGYTLVMATFAHAVNPSINAKLPYDTFKAFAPVALVARSFNIVVVNPKLPFKSLADLIAYAKANPGKLNYGSFGIGTSAHLAGELFKTMAHVDLTHVPYKGSAPAITDLLGGQIQMMFTTVASVASYIEGGQLRALAVTSAQRSAAFPDLPTISEAGVPGYAAESWYGLYAPAGTSEGAVTRLNASVARAIAAGTFKKLETNEGLSFAAGTPADFDRYVRGEAARWHELVTAAHIQAQ
ncbi:MAG: tripartite tricarboxylate transporter substrate binding protein [Rhizobiales bacterium]|nr:tripartite tricarboxylate transporter substrate binding protein [Hyphomicrobiales bacterium]